MQGSDRALPVRRDPTAPIVRRPKRSLPDFTGIHVQAGTSDVRYHEYLPAALQIIKTPAARSSRFIAYGLCGIVTVAIFASIFGYLRLFAIAPGEFQAHGGNQVVQPLEAGQIETIPVKNGDHVKKGGVVIQLDTTAATAAKAIIEAKLADERAEGIRREAAVFVARSPTIDKDAPIAWTRAIPADVRKREEAVFRADLAQLAATIADLNAQLKVKEAARDKFTANIAAQKTLIESRTQRTAMHETLEKQGWDSRAMVLQSLQPLRQDQVDLANYEGSLGEAVAAIPVIKDQITQARQTFIATNAAAAAVAEQQVDNLVQQLTQANQTLRNLTLRAPVTGTVQSLAATSIGQQVKVGEQLLQVTPDDAPLEIQAYVLNTDIGFVKVGQPVTIKVDTFPYTRYGTLEGKVTHVGADAVTGAFALAQLKNDATTPSSGSLSVTNAAEAMSDLVFPVTVIPTKTTIKVEGRDVPMAPGMSVAIEIETARQRVISYILYPLTRVFSAGS